MCSPMHEESRARMQMYVHVPSVNPSPVNKLLHFNPLLALLSSSFCSNSSTRVIFIEQNFLKVKKGVNIGFSLTATPRMFFSKQAVLTEC